MQNIDKAKQPQNCKVLIRDHIRRSALVSLESLCLFKPVNGLNCNFMNFPEYKKWGGGGGLKMRLLKKLPESICCLTFFLKLIKIKLNIKDEPCIPAP